MSVTDAVDYVRRLDPLIRIMAAERVAPALRDDAEQEARIAVWKVAQEHADDPRPLGPLLTTVARRAIFNVVNGRPMTGESGVRGRTRDPLRGQHADPLDLERDDAARDDHADEVDLRVTVAGVLDDLAPWEREYVQQRFLLDRPVAEVAQGLGMSQNGTTNAWTRRLRPLLAQRLGGM